MDYPINTAGEFPADGGVEKLQKLASQVNDLIETIRQARKNGAQISVAGDFDLSFEEDFDTDTATGRLTANLTVERQ